MSNSRDMMYRGTAPYFECTTTLIFDVGTVVLEAELTGPKINLAPNHQDYTPSHRKNRRGKLKRSGR